MPVFVLPLGNGKLKISGGTSLKMTWFGIAPPDINLVVGHIKVGDEVSIKFDWVVWPQEHLLQFAPDRPGAPHPRIACARLQGHAQRPATRPQRRAALGQPRAPLMVPPGLRNLAPGSSITCSDKNVPTDNLAKLTDGDKEASDQSIIFLRKGTQWVQMDLGSRQEIFALVIWHAHNMAKVYHDVIVRVADDPDFTEQRPHRLQQRLRQLLRPGCRH